MKSSILTSLIMSLSYGVGYSRLSSSCRLIIGFLVVRRSRLDKELDDYLEISIIEYTINIEFLVTIFVFICHKYLSSD